MRATPDDLKDVKDMDRSRHQQSQQENELLSEDLPIEGEEGGNEEWEQQQHGEEVSYGNIPLLN